MRTIIAVVGIVIVLCLFTFAGLSMGSDIRFNAGDYSPIDEAQAAVILEVAPEATRQAIEQAAAIAAIEAAALADKKAEQAIMRKRFDNLIIGGGITLIVLAACVAIVVIISMSVDTAKDKEELEKYKELPAYAQVAPDITVVTVGADHYLVDSITGRTTNLSRRQTADPVRAEVMLQLALQIQAQQLAARTRTDSDAVLVRGVEEQ